MNFDLYVNTMPFVELDQFTITHVTSKGKLIGSFFSATTDQLREWSSKGFMIEQEVDEAGLKHARDARYKHARDLELQFKNDLFAENGVVGHPKADQAFNVACEERQTYELQEIADFFETLVDLIK